MLKSDDDRNNIAALYGKAVENARRVALTLAVSRNRENPVIDIQDMTYGVTLLDYTIRAAVEAIEDNLAENELEKSKKRLLTTIREAGASGILGKELTRKSQYLNRSVRNECLDDLIEAGQVRVLRTGSGAELFKFSRTDLPPRENWHPHILILEFLEQPLLYHCVPKSILESLNPSIEAT